MLFSFTQTMYIRMVWWWYKPKVQHVKLLYRIALHISASNTRTNSKETRRNEKTKTKMLKESKKQQKNKPKKKKKKYQMYKLRESSFHYSFFILGMLRLCLHRWSLFSTLLSWYWAFGLLTFSQSIVSTRWSNKTHNDFFFMRGCLKTTQCM